MLSLEFVKEHIDEIEMDDFCDRRFTKKLLDFLPVEEWETFGFKQKEKREHNPKEWTKENIIIQLKEDLEFAIEKAINHRGISASLMYDVLRSWCMILENGLEKTAYGWYGDKLIKAVDEYYNFELFKAEAFVESRIDHIKNIIVKELHENGYEIDDFYNDGILINLDGIGFAKMDIKAVE